MELRQLEYFVTVAEEANFTRAAEKLHVAQPGISAQIRRLERELGEELFDRAGRTVRLTEVGDAVLPYARAALAAVTGTRLAVDELTGLVRGRVAVGTVSSTSTLDLPALLSSFHDAHPAVEITLLEQASDALVDALRAGRLDVAIVALGAYELPPDLRGQVIAEQPVVAVMAVGKAPATRRTIPLEDLRDQPLICMPEGTGIRSCLDDACAKAGFVPHIAFEAGNPALLASLAAKGLGTAILPGSVAKGQTGLRALTITKPKLRGRLVFAWRADGPISPAARALVELARRTLKFTV
ncbi:LysR family transcriptional regulator [Amycolatopsis minnesotensis]|uniref:LysR substrate-binding domain-containing protein n=1 Tax=Amycolatopsis minnesotensis TaxID=337894 RepID=A0ABP5D6A9_9PSEU